MAQINYLKRENNTQKVFLTEDTLNVGEILNDDYGYICDSIKKEGFILKSHECNLFKELVFDEKVVGFCSYDFSREFLTAALNNIYVLPEFRGNGLFLSELLKTMEEHNKPSIVEPTRLVVELLIGYGFAKRINDDIVASGIEFIIPGNPLTLYNSLSQTTLHINSSISSANSFLILFAKQLPLNSLFSLITSKLSKISLKLLDNMTIPQLIYSPILK